MYAELLVILAIPVTRRAGIDHRVDGTYRRSGEGGVNARCTEDSKDDEAWPPRIQELPHDFVVARPRAEIRGFRRNLAICAGDGTPYEFT